MRSVYFLCDVTHPTFTGAINTTRNVHLTNTPGTRLGARQDPAGTRAIIKVAGASRGLVNLPTLIRAYTRDELPQLKRDMNAIAPIDQWKQEP